MGMAISVAGVCHRAGWAVPHTPRGAAPGWKRMMEEMEKLRSLPERPVSLEQTFRGLHKADQLPYWDGAL